MLACILKNSGNEIPPEGKDIIPKEGEEISPEEGKELFLKKLYILTGFDQSQKNHHPLITKILEFQKKQEEYNNNVKFTITVRVAPAYVHHFRAIKPDWLNMQLESLKVRQVTERHVDQSQKFHEHAVHGRHCSRHSPETLQRGFRHRLGKFLAVRRNSQPTQWNNTIQSHCISFGDDSGSVPKSRSTNRFFVSLDCGVWRGWHQGAGGRRRHCHRQYYSSCSRVWSGV